jgi:hypothetical protein
MDEQKKEELEKVVVAAVAAAAKITLAPRPPKPYHEALRGMSHNQLRGELRRKAKNSSSPLGTIEAIALLAVLENTRSKGNPFAKLEAYMR